MENLKYNLMGICSLISIEQSQQDKLIIDNMKQVFESIYLLTEKIDKKINEKEKIKNNNNDDDYEELDDEENEKESNKIDEMLKKIIDGDNVEQDDEILSYEEKDDDEPLTNFDKQSPIIFVKNTLNAVSQKSPDIYKIIVETLGDKINVLNDIFNNEEKRLTNNK